VPLPFGINLWGLRSNILIKLHMTFTIVATVISSSDAFSR